MAESQTFELPPFDQLDISAGIVALVQKGPAAPVRVEYNNPEIFAKLRLTVEDGALTTQVDTDFFDFIKGVFGGVTGRGPDITLHITMPVLMGIDASSGASVRADGFEGEDFEADASSGGAINATVSYREINANASTGASVHLSGSCQNLRADASSGGSIDTSTLACNQLIADASSAGSIVANALDGARLEASSGGSIAVSGAPGNVEQETSSGGRISVGE